MKTRYLVKWLETNRKFNDTKETWTGTFDLEKFCKTHKVLEAWICELAKPGSDYRYVMKERII